MKVIALVGVRKLEPSLIVMQSEGRRCHVDNIYIYMADIIVYKTGGSSCHLSMGTVPGQHTVESRDSL